MMATMLALLLATGAPVAPVAPVAGQAVLPHASTAGDPHLQSVRYDPDRVVALIGHLGFQTMIEFGPDERIENVAIGDATAWQVTPNKRADLLFVKPTGHAGATNMVVVTSARTYSFLLLVAPRRASAARAVWTLRFDVPAPARLAMAATAAPVTAAGKNAGYTVQGSEALLPTAVFDDGRSTYFAWPEEVALPAIFAVNADGSEALVNFVMRDGYAMVQQTAGRFVLRQGEAMAIVISTPGITRRLPINAGRKNS